MVDIFLSYAREDEERAGELARALEGHGWDVFWDREIPAGKTWRRFIGKNLREAGCVVVCWSRHSVASQWVPEEAEEARNREVLVPVLFEDVIPPLGFRSVQAASLHHWRGDAGDPAFEQLLRDIGGVLGEGRATTPSIAEAAEGSATRGEDAKSLRPGRARRKVALWATIGAVIVAAAVTGILLVRGDGRGGSVEPARKQPARFDSPTAVADRGSTLQPAARVQADLSFVGWSLTPGSPRRGQPVQVRVGIKNQGPAPSGRFEVQWWAGVNYPRPEKVWTIGNLDPGGTKTLTYRYDGYPSWYERLQTKVVIDPSVTDPDPSNNSWVRTIAVAR